MNDTYLQIVAHALTANEVPTILKKRISLSFVEGIAAQDGHSSFKIDLEDVQTRKAAIIAHCFCVAMSGNSEDGIAFSKRSLGFIRDLLMDDNEKFQCEDSAHAILNMISEWNERSVGRCAHWSTTRSGVMRSATRRASSFFSIGMNNSGKTEPIQNTEDSIFESMLVITIMHYLWGYIIKHPAPFRTFDLGNAVKCASRFVFSSDVRLHAASFHILSRIKERMGSRWDFSGGTNVPVFIKPYMDEAFREAMKRTIETKCAIMRMYRKFKDSLDVLAVDIKTDVESQNLIADVSKDIACLVLRLKRDAPPPTPSKEKPKIDLFSTKRGRLNHQINSTLERKMIEHLFVYLAAFMWREGEDDLDDSVAQLVMERIAKIAKDNNFERSDRMGIHKDTWLDIMYPTIIGVDADKDLCEPSGFRDAYKDQVFKMSISFSRENNVC